MAIEFFEAVYTDIDQTYVQLVWGILAIIVFIVLMVGTLMVWLKPSSYENTKSMTLLKVGTSMALVYIAVTIIWWWLLYTNSFVEEVV